MSRPASLLAVFMVAASVGVEGAAGQSATDTVTAIENVTVLTMEDSRHHPGYTVVTTQGRIQAVGPAGAVPVPSGAVRIDGAGRFLMPGLVDAHVHLFDVRDLDLYLVHGVTTILNMSGARTHLALRDSLAAGSRVGPTLYTAGPQLKLEGNPALDFERGVGSPEEARRRVASTLREGYDFVKVWGAFTPEVYAAMAAATREGGGRLTGHIPVSVGLAGVLDAGQGSIAHIEEFFNKVFHRRVDDAALPQAIAPIVRRPVPVITTLVTYQAIAASAAPDSTLLLRRLGRALLDPVRQLTWEPAFNRYRGNRVGQDVFYREALAFEGRIARALQTAGVPLVLGTDAGEIPGLVPGLEAHRELEALVTSGLSPLEALQAGTRNAGAFLGSADDRFGTIRVGSRADLLLLDDDPTRDVGNTRHIAGVMSRGTWHAKEELAGRLASLQAANRRMAPIVGAILQGGAEAGRAAAARILAEDPRPGSPTAPFAETPMILLAYALAQRGDMANAVGVLRMVTEAYPRAYLASYILGGALLQAGRNEEARAALTRVLELVPGHEEATAMLAKATTR